MKKLVYSAIILIVWCSLVNKLNAQNLSTNLKEGDPVPQ